MTTSSKLVRTLRLVAAVCLFVSILQMAVTPSDGESQRVIGFCQGVSITNYDQVLGGHPPILDNVKYTNCTTKYIDSLDISNLTETNVPSPKSNVIPMLKATLAIVALLVL